MKRALLLPILLSTLALAGCASSAAPAAKPSTALSVAAPEPPQIPANAEDFVSVEAATSNRFLRESKNGSMLVRLRITPKVLKDAPRPPINLGVVVDTSGSMEGAAIDDARAACLSLLDTLSEGDRLALVAFHSSADVLLPSTRLTKENMAEVRARIGAMKARGTTDLAGGLSAGLGEVMKSFQASGVNRVVLLSDGVPNEEAPILPLARSAGQQGVSITALGLGLEINETLVGMVAGESGGKYHFVKDSSKVASVFRDEVLRLKRVVGRGASIALSPGPGVVVEEVVGLPSSRQGNRVNVLLGDMSEGDARDIVVRLSVSGRRAGSVVELLDANLAFEGASAPGRRLVANTFVSARASDDAAVIEAGRDREVERAAARVGLADKIVKAVAAARGGNVQLATSILDAAEKEAKTAQKELDDAELGEKLRGLGSLRQSLPELAKQAQLQQAAAVAPARMPVQERPMSAAPAAIIMETQADAIRTIQGQ
jgi:Ca-activated chloride channel homolog